MSIAASMSRWVAATMRTSTPIWPRAADALHRALLEHAQQFHLHLGRHVADLVEEQGAAIGLLEPALMLGDGRR